MQCSIDTEVKDISLFVGSQGVTNDKTLGYLVKQNLVTEELVEIERGTLVEVEIFNPNTNKIRVKCIKGVKSFSAEVDSLFLLEHCSFSYKELMSPVEAIIARHYVKSIIDKDTLVYISLSILLMLVGFLFGKVM